MSESVIADPPYSSMDPATTKPLETGVKVYPAAVENWDDGARGG